MGRSALKSEEVDLGSERSTVALSDVFFPAFANKRVPSLLDVSAVVVNEAHSCNVSARMRATAGLIRCMTPICCCSQW